MPETEGFEKRSGATMDRRRLHHRMLDPMIPYLVRSTGLFLMRTARVYYYMLTGSACFKMSGRLQRARRQRNGVPAVVMGPGSMDACFRAQQTRQALEWNGMLAIFGLDGSTVARPANQKMRAPVAQHLAAVAVFDATAALRRLPCLVRERAGWGPAMDFAGRSLPLRARSLSAQRSPARYPHHLRVR